MRRRVRLLTPSLLAHLFLFSFFLPAILLAVPKFGTASFQGTQNNGATPNQMNSVLPASIEWSTGNIDATLFSHSTSANPHEITIQQSGDYFVAFTLPLTAISGERLTVRAELFNNGTAVAGMLGESSYARGLQGTTQNFQSSSHFAGIISLTAGDVIDVRVLETSVLVASMYAVDGASSLYLELVEPSRTVFSSLSNSVDTGTNLNPPIASPVAFEWTNNIRSDVGFTHNPVGVASEEVIIDTPGFYFVTLNIPINTAVERASPEVTVEINGTVVTGGEAKQGYIRNDVGNHSNASIHWSGVVETTVANSVLKIVTRQEAQTGTVIFQTGKSASLHIEELPSEKALSVSGTELTTGTNWNGSTAGVIEWETSTITDANFFTHSTTVNPQQITIERNGDYLLIYNDAFTSTQQRANPAINVRVNGANYVGATVKSHYIRALTGHDDSSGSLVILLEDLAQGDIVSVTAGQSDQTGTVNISAPALLTLGINQEMS